MNRSNVGKNRIRGQMLAIFFKYFLDPLYKNTFFMISGSMLNAVCGLLFWMLAAKLYSLEDVGTATTLISLLGLVILFSRLGFDVSIVRFFPMMDKQKVFCTSLFITTGVTLLISLGYIAVRGILSPSLYPLESLAYSGIFILTALAYSISLITGNVFIANRRAEGYFYQNIILASRMYFLIPLNFLGSIGILSSWGLACIFASALAFLPFSRSLPLQFSNLDYSFIRRSFSFSFWNYTSSILSAVPTLILPIMIFNILGGAKAAMFYIAFNVGNIVQIISASIGNSILVEGSHGRDLKETVIQSGVAVFIIMVPAVIMLYFFGGFILGILKPEYLGAQNLLKVLALSSIFVAMYTLFVPIQNVRMAVKSIVKLNLIRCLLLIVLSYLLIPMYGITGLGIAWGITYAILDIIILIEVKRENWF